MRLEDSGPHTDELPYIDVTHCNSVIIDTTKISRIYLELEESDEKK
jgi:hypothetical protein